jgi:hypothetical protein
MDISFNFVHFTDGIQRAELSAETNDKIYTYRFVSYGDIQSFVNFKPVDTMPITVSTKKLSFALDKVQSQLIKMLVINDSADVEYRRLFWEVKDILKTINNN